MNKERFITLCAIIMLLSISRLLPHPANVTPIAAMGLFAGAFFEKKWLAFAVPILAMLTSDLVLGFHSTMWAVYASFAIIVCMGFWLKGKAQPLMIATTMLAGSVVFFVITNFAVWLSGEIYPLTTQGLTACFVAAVPFFTNTALGDLFYTALLFGGFALAEKNYSFLASTTTKLQ